MNEIGSEKEENAKRSDTCIKKTFSEQNNDHQIIHRVPSEDFYSIKSITNTINDTNIKQVRDHQLRIRNLNTNLDQTRKNISKLNNDDYLNITHNLVKFNNELTEFKIKYDSHQEQNHQLDFERKLIESQLTSIEKEIWAAKKDENIDFHVSKVNRVIEKYLDQVKLSKKKGY